MTTTMHASGESQCQQKTQDQYPADDTDSGTNKLVLLQLLRTQVEYYFSVQNLATDEYLRTIMSTNNGRVPTDLIAKFPKIQRLYKSHASQTDDCCMLLSNALRTSASVVVEGGYMYRVASSKSLLSQDSNRIDKSFTQDGKPSTAAVSPSSSSSSTELDTIETDWIGRDAKDIDKNNNLTLSTCSPTSFASETVNVVPSTNSVVDGNDNGTVKSNDSGGPDSINNSVKKLQTLTMDPSHPTQQNKEQSVQYSQQGYPYHYHNQQQQTHVQMDHLVGWDHYQSPLTYGYPAVHATDNYQGNQFYYPPYYYDPQNMSTFQSSAGPGAPTRIVAPMSSYPYAPLAKGIAVDPYANYHFYSQYQYRNQPIPVDYHFMPAHDYHSMQYHHLPQEQTHHNNSQYTAEMAPTRSPPDAVESCDINQSKGVREDTKALRMIPPPDVVYVQPTTSLQVHLQGTQLHSHQTPHLASTVKQQQHQEVPQPINGGNGGLRKWNNKNRRNSSRNNNNHGNRQHHNRNSNKETTLSDGIIQDSDVFSSIGTEPSETNINISNCSSTIANVQQQVNATLSFATDNVSAKDHRNGNTKKHNRRSSNTTNPINSSTNVKNSRKNNRVASHKQRDDAEKDSKSACIRNEGEILSDENFPALCPSPCTSSIAASEHGKNILTNQGVTSNSIRLASKTPVVVLSNDGATNDHLPNEIQTPVRKTGYAAALLNKSTANSAALITTERTEVEVTLQSKKPVSSR